MTSVKEKNRVIYLPAAARQKATLQTRHFPSAGPGSAVIQVLAVSLRANFADVYRNPDSGHPLPLPFIPRFAAIGRIAGAEPDATKLKAGQLVFFDQTIRGRDNDGFYISGMMEVFDDPSRKLSRGEFRDSTHADFAKVVRELPSLQ